MWARERCELLVRAIGRQPPCLPTELIDEHVVRRWDSSRFEFNQIVDRTANAWISKMIDWCSESGKPWDAEKAAVAETHARWVSGRRGAYDSFWPSS